LAAIIEEILLRYPIDVSSGRSRQPGLVWWDFLNDGNTRSSPIQTQHGQPRNVLLVTVVGVDTADLFRDALYYAFRHSCVRGLEANSVASAEARYQHYGKGQKMKLNRSTIYLLAYLIWNEAFTTAITSFSMELTSFTP